MRDYSYIAPGYAGKALNGSRTFVGVLRECFISNGEYDAISKPWNDRTKSSYIRDYEKRIIPLMLDGKALSSYDNEDALSLLDSIKREHPAYSITTMSHYRYLFWRVYKAGLDNGWYEDKLHWGDLGFTGSTDILTAAARRRMLINKKSYSISEEMRIMKWFTSLDPTTCDGYLLGFLLMFFFGLRNQEACGLNYGDIRMLSKSNQFPVMYIVRTTGIRSNKIQGRGKTYNFARILPVFTFVYDFLMKRKAYIQSLIDNGSLELKDGIRSIDDVPIVCRRTDLLTRASAQNMTEYGGTMLRDNGIGTYAYEFLEYSLFLDRLSGENVGEKHPTPYLNRRNAGMHLAGLGLKAGEIQFYIGHELVDPAEMRNYFANEDHIARLNDSLKKHPYYVLYNQTKNEDIITLDNMRKGEEAFIRVVAKEPCDPITIGRRTDGPYKYTVAESINVQEEGYSEIVDIKDKVLKVYLKHIGEDRSGK